MLAIDEGAAPGGTAELRFKTVSLTPLVGTTLSGKVVDPGPDLKPMTFDDIRAGADGALFTGDDVFLLPIAHARVWIIGLEDQFVFTDDQGNFSFDAVPAGDIKLAIDGRTATGTPAGVFFPEMVLDLVLDAGRANTVMGTMGSLDDRAANRDRQEVYLPRLQSSLLHDVSGGAPTTIGVDALSAPNLTPQQRAMLSIQVQPGSLVDASGNPLAAGQVGISTVPPELVREMLPPGLLQHTFDITVQTPGITNFSTPAPLTIPNVFNAAPGTQLNFLSFDHTTGRLMIEGTATVSADGLSATTDPGTGITHPGWHGLTPPGSPAGPKPPPSDRGCETAPMQALAGTGAADSPLKFAASGSLGQGKDQKPFVDMQDFFFTTSKAEGALTFTNTEPANACPPGSKLIVNVTVNDAAKDFLKGLTSTTVPLQPGETHRFTFRPKAFSTKELSKFGGDRLYGVQVKIEVLRVGSDGKPTPIAGAPEPFYIYRYVDASDDDATDGIIRFNDTLNDGSGAVTRDRFVSYRGDPAAQPTVKAIVAGGTTDFQAFNTPGQIQITLDPLRTQDNITAAIQIVTPAPGNRQVNGPMTLHATGDAVGPQTVYLNKAQFVRVLRDLAHDASPVQVVLEYTSSLVTNPPTNFFQLSLPDEPSPNTFAFPIGASEDEVANALQAVPSIGLNNVTVKLNQTDLGIGPGRFKTLRDTYTITPENAFADRATPTFEVSGVNTGTALKSKVVRMVRPGLLTQDQRTFLLQPGKTESMFDAVVGKLDIAYAALKPAIVFSTAAAPTPADYRLEWVMDVPAGGETAHFPTTAFDRLKPLLPDITKKNSAQAAFLVAQALDIARRDTSLVHLGTYFMQEAFEPGLLGRANASDADLINAFAQVVAHESGHALGLAHTAFPDGATGTSELQTITVKPGVPEFNLTYAGATTVNLLATATPQEVQEQLLSLYGLQGTKIQVTGPNGGPYTINFDPNPSIKPRSIFAGADVPQITGVGVDPSTQRQGSSETVWGNNEMVTL